MHKAAEGLEDLSPEIARVRGLQSARMEMARLDRAQRTGGELAQLEAARGRIAESVYDVQTRILEVGLKLVPLVEGVLDGVNVGVRQVDHTLATMFKTLNPFEVDDAKKQDAQDKQAEKTAKALKNALDEFYDRVDPHLGIDPFFHALLYDTHVPGPQRNPPPNLGQFP